MSSIQQLNDRIQEEAHFIPSLLSEIGKSIVGQKALINRLLIALFTDGHVLIEGVPGLAKTLSVRVLAQALDLSFQRIQFTPDLLPADLIGTHIYNPRNGEFIPRLGPIFHQIILADEINRAPAKVQSALLEAMEEKQVTLGEETHLLDDPFMVLATQNPLEQEGTYPLPEAQLDRFMLKVIVEYPSKDEERAIVDRMTGVNTSTISKIINKQIILHVREIIQTVVYVDDRIKDYVVNLVTATRKTNSNGLRNLSGYIEYGASPRASINLIKAAKAMAFLNSRAYVIPDDIKQIAPDILRHRIGISFEAEAENVSSDHIIERLLAQIPVP